MDIKERESSIKIDSIKFNKRIFTTIFAGWDLIWILVDWFLDKDFQKALLNKFDDFEIYNYKWELNIKQADFITKYFEGWKK
jgi:hypothetical protein